MSEKSSEARTMRELVASVAGPREWSDTRQSWLARAARRSGLTYRTMKALWYGEIDDPKHYAAQLLQIAANKAALAQTFGSGNADDCARADVLRDQARRFHSVDDRR